MGYDFLIQFYNNFLDFYYINSGCFIDFLTIIFVLILIIQYNLIYTKNKALHDELKETIECNTLKIANEIMTEQLKDLKLRYDEIDKKNAEFKKYITNKIISQNDEILIIKKLAIGPIEKLNLSVQKLDEQFFEEKKDVENKMIEQTNSLLYSIEAVEKEFKEIIQELKDLNCLR